jgi:hypothetical protein
MMKSYTYGQSFINAIDGYRSNQLMDQSMQNNNTATSHYRREPSRRCGLAIKSKWTLERMPVCV